MKTINYFGKNYLVLTRTKSKPTEECPFCGSKHIHGSADGHRFAHCSTEKRKDLVIVDGIEVFSEHGYFIETI